MNAAGGRVLCHERVVNNAARERGKYVRGERDRPRHIVEREASNDNTPAAARLRADERAKDAAVSRRQRLTRNRHQESRAKLVADHRERVSTVRIDAKRDIAATRTRIQEQFRPGLLAQQRRHETELRQFQEREGTFLGRMTNRLKSLSLKSLIHGNTRQSALTEGFQAIASAGARLEQLKNRQKSEQRKVLTQQRAAEALQVRRIRLQEQERRREANELFKVNRAELQLSHRMDDAVARAAWKQRRTDREQAWDSFERENPTRTPSVPASLTEISREPFSGRSHQPQQEQKRPGHEGDSGRER